MTKLHVLLLICFLATFAAGSCAGVLWERAHRPPADPWLGELDLTAKQREDIKAIWMEARRLAGLHAQKTQREAARKKCDEALKALIPSSQMKNYDNIMREYNEELAGIERKAKEVMDEAYQRTKALLPEDQRAQYEEIRKKNLERRTHTETGNTPSAEAETKAGQSKP
jgi:Spy/CpxP family protein refolding chaperone